MKNRLFVDEKDIGINRMIELCFVADGESKTTWMLLMSLTLVTFSFDLGKFLTGLVSDLSYARRFDALQ